MTTNELMQSGFVHAFLEKYIEERFDEVGHLHSLEYSFCSSDYERKDLTIKDLGKARKKITKLGYEDLSIAYLRSNDVNDTHNYIKENNLKFWIDRFAEEFESHITYENQEIERIVFASHMSEIDIMDDIKFFQENSYWSFDFDTYKLYSKETGIFATLMNLSELLFQLCLYNELNYYLTEPQHIKTINPKEIDKAAFYALNYLLECNANGIEIPFGKKSELERVGNEIFKKADLDKSGNTFYKNVNKILKMDYHNNTILENFFGLDWKASILNLSSDKETLSKYLEQNYS